MSTVKEDGLEIIRQSIQAVLPKEAVEKALAGKEFSGKVVVVAIGKAGYTMAKAAKEVLKDKVTKGVVVTKYDHIEAPIDGFEMIEAGHPVPDDNSILGTKKAIEAVSGLTENDTVIFLISGGGSALFEKPGKGITLEDIKGVTKDLLACGADIVEINTIRKHLSDVKGGKFAVYCKPAKVYSVVLSDVIGDRLDSIASGPAYADSSTCEDVNYILNKYQLKFDERIMNALKIETPKTVDNVETVITGSVAELCKAAAKECERLGYRPYVISSTLECEAKEAGKFLASMAREIRKEEKYGIKAPCAVIAGGETVVRIVGDGLGGRNQEIALSAALGIDGLEETAVFSVGSDGTDGPTDAAGGIVDGTTNDRLKEMGISIEEVLLKNDSYHALEKSGDLVITGPTGTNVNDLMVLLCR
jgi:glycerate 2-kinase